MQLICAKNDNLLNLQIILSWAETKSHVRSFPLVAFFTYLTSKVHGLEPSDVHGLTDTYSFFLPCLIDSVRQHEMQWFVLTNSEIATLMSSV